MRNGPNQAAAVMFGLLLAMLTPVSAHAFGTQRLELAAYAFWGDELKAACPTGLTVVRRLPSEDPDLDGVDAAGWANEPFGGQYFCKVNLSDLAPDAFTWMGECPTALHEAGHVIGYEHGWPGRGHIMDAYSVTIRSDGRVRRHGRWVRSVSWSGPGAAWCRRFAERYYKKSFTREKLAPIPDSI